jgi:hypothetical protein
MIELLQDISDKLHKQYLNVEYIENDSIYNSNFDN